ncbi:hypothetical protein [Deefgea tanakiae]
MVVGIHTVFLKDISLEASYLTQDGLFRIAVPIFLIINGFYFYSAISNNNSALWIKRLFHIYLFWMILYAYFWFRPSELTFIELKK